MSYEQPTTPGVLQALHKAGALPGKESKAGHFAAIAIAAVLLVTCGAYVLAPLANQLLDHLR
jgi:hypothetical protein